jgi:hypothetical protein
MESTLEASSRLTEKVPREKIPREKIPIKKVPRENLPYAGK